MKLLVGMENPFITPDQKREVNIGEVLSKDMRTFIN
jgi:hypothetical protein